MKTNENECEAVISAVAHGGDGICRIDGQVCFVAGGLPEDRVRLQIRNRSRGVLWGQIIEIIEPSPHRIAVEDDHPLECGGCSWRLFAYPAQALWKQRFVTDSLERIGGIQATVGWLESPDLRTGYRTRAQFHSHQGRFGHYAVNTHRVVPIDSCPLCHENLNTALQRLQNTGQVSDVDVVVNPEGLEIMVWTKKAAAGLKKAFVVVESPENRATPSQFLFDSVPIVNGAFSQSSLLLNRLLVNEVRRKIGEAESLLDLYCGNGNLSLHVKAARVLGLDHDASATKAANELGRGRYQCADETAFRDALEEKWDAVLLDPPRTGAKAIVDSLAACPTPVIVYVSCDPATLARDLKVLTSRGWQLTDVTAIDLFPNTPHVETVCRLARK